MQRHEKQWSKPVMVEPVRKNRLRWFVILLGTLSAIVLIFSGCSRNAAAKIRLPNRAPDAVLTRAAVLATGDVDELGTISDGALLAYEALNRAGVPTVIRDRTLLADTARLDRYGIIVASTLFGYHDTDRRFSLTFMDDDQLERLSDWVNDGGVLVIGENFGRNRRDGTDRLVEAPVLDSETWPLAAAVGTPLVERNLLDFTLHMKSSTSLGAIWRPDSREAIARPEWILTPAPNADTSGIEILGYWVNGEQHIPAAWSHRFGEGTVISFTAFRLLHPALDGGLASPDEIDNFYSAVTRLTSAGIAARKGNTALPMVSVTPWPKDRPAALAVTLNSTGNEERLEATLLSLLEYAPKLTVFVTHPELFPENLRIDLKDRVEIATLSSSDQPLDELEFQVAREAIPLPEFSPYPLKGFRFPRLAPTLPLLEYLDRIGYSYDSSLPVNHLDYYAGSVFPMNVALSSPGENWTLKMLEMGPVYRDDWSFYGNAKGDREKEIALYGKFLLGFWNDVAIPGHGLMTQIGDVKFEGESEATLEPLKSLIRKALDDGAWVTGLGDIARFWSAREKATISLWREKDRCFVSVRANGEDLNGVTLRVDIADNERFGEYFASKDGRVQPAGKHLLLICGGENETNFSFSLIKDKGSS